MIHIIYLLISHVFFYFVYKPQNFMGYFLTYQLSQKMIPYLGHTLAHKLYPRYSSNDSDYKWPITTAKKKEFFHSFHQPITFQYSSLSLPVSQPELLHRVLHTMFQPSTILHISVFPFLAANLTRTMRTSSPCCIPRKSDATKRGLPTVVGRFLGESLCHSRIRAVCAGCALLGCQPRVAHAPYSKT